MWVAAEKTRDRVISGPPSAERDNVRIRFASYLAVGFGLHLVAGEE
jgi:hypothetical protein